MMKKRLAKLASVVLAVALLFSLAVPAMAAEPPPEGESEIIVDPDIVEAPVEPEPEDESAPPEEDSQPPEDVVEPAEEAQANTDSDLGGEDVLKGAADELPGMPDGYVLSPSQLAEKKDITGSGVVKAMEEEQEEGTDYVPDMIIFLCDSEEEANTIAAAYGCDLLYYQYGVGTALIREETPFTVQQLVSISADMGNNMPPVSPNHIYGISGEPAAELAQPNEPIYFPGARDNSILFKPAPGSTYTSDPSLEGYQWFHDTIGTYTAWDVTEGEGVKVAVLDTGITPGHVDFAHLASSGRLEYVSTAKTIATRNASGTIIYLPESEWNNDVDPTDRGGHGTHVNGLVAANNDAVNGGTGVAPGVSLLSVQVFQTDSSIGTMTDHTIAGINRAVALGADVINMSLGGISYNTGYQAALTAAFNSDVTVFAAAGNEGVGSKAYPAGYNNVISVGASDENNGKAGFSNFGSWVDISAPGVRMVSTYNTSNSAYYLTQGTSMACPVAAGVGALLKSANPGMSPAQIEAKLKATGTKATASGIGKIVNIAAALAVAPAKPTIDSVTDAGAEKIRIAPSDASNKICYTIDGSTPVMQDGVAVNGFAYTAPFELPADGKFTVKAVNYNVVGKGSAVVSKQFTRVSTTKSISINAHPGYLAKGKSITFKATATPYNTSTKGALEWSVTGAGASAVEINKTTGKMTFKNDVSGTPEVQVTATWTADGGPYTDTTAPIKLYQNVTSKVVWNGDYAGTTLFTRTPVGHTGSDPTTVSLQAIARDKNGTPINIASATDFFTWKSSNTKVATVGADGVVKATGKGTATITATAVDGSNKKVTQKVTVNVPVSSITIFSNLATQNGDYDPGDRAYAIAYGKTIKLKAAFGAAYGVPSNKKLKWELVGATTVESSKLTAHFGSNIKINENTGAVSMNKKLGNLFNDNVIRFFYVRATAQDGSGTTATIRIQTFHPTTTFYLYGYSSSTGYGWYPSNRFPNKTIDGKGAWYGASNSIQFMTDGMYNYSVKSSNYSIVSTELGILTSGGSQVGGVLYYTVFKNGTATMKVTANDGSNKSLTFKIKVSGISKSDTGHPASVQIAGEAGGDNWIQTPNFPGDPTLTEQRQGPIVEIEQIHG